MREICNESARTQQVYCTNACVKLYENVRYVNAKCPKLQTAIKINRPHHVIYLNIPCEHKLNSISKYKLHFIIYRDILFIYRDIVCVRFTLGTHLISLTV